MKSPYIDINTAQKIVELNNIRCCAICNNYHQLVGNSEGRWYCDEAIKEFMDEDFINIYKRNICERWKGEICRKPLEVLK